jgi:hypothetical protein
MRTNEVKSGTGSQTCIFSRFFTKIQVFIGISAKGLKFILKITDPSDLNRDVLKAFYLSF